MITVYYRKALPLQKEGAFSQIMDGAYIPFMEKLDKRRREKILRIKNEKSRVRELTAGMLLYDALCSQLGLSSADTPPFAIAYGEKGKPYLPGREGIHFNISHSGDYVCVAVSDSPVGVDIQEKPGKRSGDSDGECLAEGGYMNSIKEKKIAERFYTPSDKKRLALCGEEEYGDLFYRMWSIKESYIKLTGEGMSKGLSGFEIDWKERKILDTESKETSAYFWEQQGIENYSLCVCAFTSREVVWKKME